MSCFQKSMQKPIINLKKKFTKENFMSYQKLKHTKWECKYHVIFIPKFRKKVIYGHLRKELGPVLHDLALRKESRIEEGHLMGDHVHMLLSVPPKYSLAQVIGFIKGKSAIWIARNFSGKARNFTVT